MINPVGASAKLRKRDLVCSRCIHDRRPKDSALRLRLPMDFSHTSTNLVTPMSVNRDSTVSVSVTAEEKEIWAKALAEVVQHNIEEAGKTLPRAAKAVWSRIRTKTDLVFRDYLAFAVERYSSTKTILYRDEPIPLYEFYEPITLTRAGGPIPSFGFEDLLKQPKHLAVLGTAGAGKSTLLKHLFLGALDNKSRIPVFVELRALNEESKNLVTLIFEALTLHRESLTHEEMLHTLEWGRFVFFLDGFDEIHPDKRGETYRYLKKLSDRYDRNYWIVTSRPDSQVSSWERFRILRAQPLDLNQSVRLVERLRFDQRTKTKFAKMLKEGMFAEHESFVRNPLLLTIMLMTFRDNADIPYKKHLLYEQVFLTLYNQHDAVNKETFKRRMHAGLARDDFERVLAAFSILGFLQSKTEFDEYWLKHLLKMAIGLAQIEVEIDAYLSDLLESVCVLMKVGHSDFEFTHRSFQEFFTAKYILDTDETTRIDILKQITREFRDPQVFTLLFEMNREQLERLIIYPKLRQLVDAMEVVGRPGSLTLARLHAHLFGSLQRNEYSGEWHVGDVNYTDYNFLSLIRQLYPSHYNEVEQDSSWDTLSNLLEQRKENNRVSLSEIALTSDADLRSAVCRIGLVTEADVAMILSITQSVHDRQQESALRGATLGLRKRRPDVQALG